jgi:hypothetical protein
MIDLNRVRRPDRKLPHSSPSALTVLEPCDPLNAWLHSKKGKTIGDGPLKAARSKASSRFPCAALS